MINTIQDVAIQAARREWVDSVSANPDIDFNDVTSDWCRCDNLDLDPDNPWMFADEHACWCMSMHHYHCPFCGGLKQVG